MINHVVLFKLKDYPAEEKKNVLAEFKEMLLALKGKINELKHIEVGENYELDSKNYDLALISHFEIDNGNELSYFMIISLLHHIKRR